MRRNYNISMRMMYILYIILTLLIGSHSYSAKVELGRYLPI